MKISKFYINRNEYSSTSTLSLPMNLQKGIALSSTSSWKKFTTDASYPNSYTLDSSIEPDDSILPSGLLDLFNRIEQAMEEGRFENVLIDIDYIQEYVLPLVNDLIYCVTIGLKELCYEKMRRYDLALGQIEQIFATLEKHTQIMNDLDLNDFIDKQKRSIDYRKAALLLNLNQIEPALKILKAHEIENDQDIFIMYRLIEKKLNIQLFDPTIPIEYIAEDDWFEPAFKGDIKEAINSLDPADKTSYKHAKALIYAMNGNFDHVDDISIMNEDEDFLHGFPENPLNLIFIWLKK